MVEVAARVLGPLSVVIDGVDVTPAAPKERALLALLVINHGVVVSADRLMEELWPNLAADRARRVLQVRVAAVRKMLGTADAAHLLELVPPGYRLAIADGGHRRASFRHASSNGRELTPTPASRPEPRTRSVRRSGCGGASHSPMCRSA